MRWKKIGYVCLGIIGAILLLYVIILPVFVKQQIKNTDNVSIEYCGTYIILKETSDVIKLKECIKLASWKRSFKDQVDTVPNVYMVMDEYYLVSFRLGNTPGYVEVSVSFRPLMLELGNYKMERRYYEALILFCNQLKKQQLPHNK